MSAPTSIQRALLPLLLAAAAVTALASCATSTPTPRGAYRLVWTATRTADKTPLIATSMAVAVGRSTTIRTDSTRPTEDKPAFPAFTARLSRAKTPGVIQLVTRADLRETARNKKGKLKVSKRNVGALVDIRPGETQIVSLPSDAVHLEVRLERD